MCGIWTYLSLSKLTTQTITRLFNSFYNIKHRGPDKTIFMNYDNIYMGFHRLALLDTSALGDQPFIKSIKNRTIYTLCNGEIYNYKDLISKFNLNTLSHSDCEVIPELYIKLGFLDMLLEIKGEFAFIIIDVNHLTGKIIMHAARDIFGVRPLFYFSNLKKESSNAKLDDNLGIGFCSELKGLNTLTSSSIEVFPPGHYMTFTDDLGIMMNYYYDYNKLSNLHTIQSSLSNNLTKDLHNLLKTINTVFTKAVLDRLQTDREIGSLLSGGVDSSLVAAIASNELKKYGKQIKTFSIGTKDSTDLYYANMVAKHINSDHHIIIFDPIEALQLIPTVIKAIETYDITTIRASTVQYMLMQEVSKYCPCILNGDGSDEVAGSYLYLHSAPNTEEYHKEVMELLKNIHKYDVLRVDRTIANHGVEARIPFLDIDYVECYLSIDPELRKPRPSEILGIKDNIEKALIREAFLEDNIIPKEVLCRKKEAFSDGCSNPETSWYKIIQNHIDTLITDEEFLNKKYTFKHNAPQTKEAYYYRKIFNEIYGDENSIVIPKMWLPKWSGNIQEPSARVLKVYNS